MKKVRLILSASMMALMGLSVATFTSCTPDAMECEAGYTGKDCTDLIRTPLLGAFDALGDTNDADGSAMSPYVATIAKHDVAANIKINNLNGYFDGSTFQEDWSVYASVETNGKNVKFTIPEQKPDGESTVKGNGEYDAGTEKITIHYSVDYAGKINNYTGTWNKK